MIGTVRFFSHEKGFGFIDGQDGLKYFVHFSMLEDKSEKRLTEGEKVEFSPGKNAKGLFADRVKFL